MSNHHSIEAYLSKLGTIFSQTLGRNSKNPLARKMCAISDSILGYLNGCVCLPEERILNGICISNWGLKNKSGTETQNGELYITHRQTNQPPLVTGDLTSSFTQIVAVPIIVKVLIEAMQNIFSVIRSYQWWRFQLSRKILVKFDDVSKYQIGVTTNKIKPPPR